MRLDPGPRPTNAQLAAIETTRAQVHLGQANAHRNRAAFTDAVGDYAAACRAAGVLQPPAPNLWPGTAPASSRPPRQTAGANPKE